MATPATVSTYITTALAQGLTYAQMLEAVKYALISGISDRGVTVSVGSGGTSITFSLDQITNLLKALNVLAKSEAGMILRPGEMVSL